MNFIATLTMLVPIRSLAEDPDQQRNDDYVYFGLAFFLVCFGLAFAYDCANSRELIIVRNTMTERRQQLCEEGNEKGISTDEEANDARCGLFVSKFHFQSVLPDKSNISPDSLRNDTSRSADYWRKRLSTKDECFVCLECFTPGETICVPINKRCNHVQCLPQRLHLRVAEDKGSLPSLSSRGFEVAFTILGFIFVL